MKAEKKTICRLIKTAKGQLEGVLKMIEEDRYCIDISHQLLAAEAILQKANREILCAHMKSCVREALENGGGEEKIEELIALMEKMGRLSLIHI